MANTIDELLVIIRDKKAKKDLKLTTITDKRTQILTIQTQIDGLQTDVKNLTEIINTKTQELLELI